MNCPKHPRRRRTWLAALCLTVAAFAATANGAAPAPSNGVASVDGNPAEWDTSNDFFSDMIRAGGNGGQTKVESKLFLRYDCSSQVMYALVKAEPGLTIPTNLPSDNFVKIGGVKKVDGSYGDDGTAPDFHYILSPDPTKATGWEASFSIAPGSYTLNVHAQVDDGGLQTSAVPGRAIPLVVECGEVPQPKPLKVTKSAETWYSRSFDWSVTKSAAPSSKTTTENTATFDYTVTVTKSQPLDSGFTVTGQITVANPNSSPASGVTVTDTIDGGPTCTVQGGSNLTIPAYDSVSLPYACSVTSAAPGLNVATATWSYGASSGEADFSFGAPASVTNDTVDVMDAFNGAPAAAIQGGDNLADSAVFTYSRTVEVPASGCLQYPNKATIVSPDELVRDAVAMVEACRTPPVPPVVPPVVSPPTPPQVIGVQSASLAVTKRGPRIARAGTVVTYAITVRNTNPTNAATSVVVSDLLPVGYSVAQRPKGTKFLKGRLIWNLGTLAAGASKTVKVKIHLDRSAAGTRCNTGVASAGNAPTVRARACTRVLAVLGAARLPIVTG